MIYTIDELLLCVFCSAFLTLVAVSLKQFHQLKMSMEGDRLVKQRKERCIDEKTCPFLELAEIEKLLFKGGPVAENFKTDFEARMKAFKDGVEGLGEMERKARKK